MYASDCGDLVGDCPDSVESLLACDVEVVLDLLRCKFISPSLHLDERYPDALTAGYSDQSIWIEAVILQHERHLDKCLDESGWSPEPRRNGSPKLTYGTQHS